MQKTGISSPTPVNFSGFRITIKKYLSFLRISFLTLKEYRFDFFGNFFRLPFDIVIIVLIWHALYKYAGPFGDYTLSKMLTYQLMVQTILASTGKVSILNYQVWSDIYHGNLTIYLARPLNYMCLNYTKLLGTVIINLVFRLILFFLTSLILHLPLLNDLLIWGLFILSVLFAFTINFCIQFIIGSLTFWFEAIFGIRDIIVTLNQILAGMLIPISLFPQMLRHIAFLLPFQFTLYIPVSIYQKQISLAETLQMVCIQILWVVILLLISVAVWNRGIRRYEAQGG